jgi:L-threonylcarbamoyladenylate synthase
MENLVPATPENIARAASLIRSGKLVAFPTETVYGLGANALDAVAVERIFVAKGRPAKNPLIVHIAEIAEVHPLVADWPTIAQQLADAFWPGPLTLVVRKSSLIPDNVTAGGSTVAIRCPAHPVARALLKEAGVPIAAPSANRSGELSPTTALHVQRSLGDCMNLILDGGPCPGGLESTVIDVTGSIPKLLRPGLISVPQLEAILGQIETSLGATDTALPSPGMLAKHYSPRTALECAATPEEAAFLVNLYETAGLKVAKYELDRNPATAGAKLYSDLHVLDHGGFDRIIVPLPPDTEDWRAIRDRLTRAAAEEELP